MLGVSDNVHILRESIVNVKQTLARDGILKMNFGMPHNKRYSPKKIEYPTAYEDVRLEPDYKQETSLLCDLTFWAVEFLYLCDNTSFTI